MPPQSEFSETYDVSPKESPVKEVLFNGVYYDVTEWRRRHPGGKIIDFYTTHGEDATFAIQQFHARSFPRLTSIMSSLKKRPQLIDEKNNELIERHEELSLDFSKLYEDLVNEGFFKPSIPHVVYRLCELVGFCIFGMWAIANGNFLMKIIGVLSFAFFQGRSGWLMHEGGHHSLTGNPKIDRLIQAIVYGVGDGMSSSWWSSQHNRHHAMPQRLQRDVDLETLPLLAFNSSLFKKGNFFIRNQKILFLAIDTLLVSLLWKIYLHPRYVLLKKQYNQLGLMALHYVLAYQIGFIPYILSLWLASIYIFGNFSLSHTHLPVTDKTLHWVEFAFLHTMDIRGGILVDWWMSYLNYQIEHHLFPTMPQFRHPLIAERVQKFASKHHLPYLSDNYFNAVKKTFHNLEQVGKHSH